MKLEDLDLAKLSKLTSDFIDELKCLECCKYYIAPSTSTCGHTLCHTCWMGRHTCPECASTFNRKELKPNIPLQTLTQHVQSLGDAFEKLFNVKLDEFNLDTPEEVESEKDPDKNVKYWLTSSQNHFSAPIQNTDIFSQESAQPVNPLQISTSNIIIHSDVKKMVTPNKLGTAATIHVTPPQDDWDKIEQMPDIDNKTKYNVNIVGPMDIEPFLMDDIAYTTDKPRRSSRKKDLKHSDSDHKINAFSSKKQISKDLSCETDKKSQKGKQAWNNVKKMRKEFSKLNKPNRSKLNVSIEMVKKVQNVNTISNTPLIITQQAVNIDENTPDKENESIMAASNNDPIDKILEPNSSEKLKKSINSDVKPYEQQHISKSLVLNENAVLNNENICKNNNMPKNMTSSIALETVSSIEDKNNPAAKMSFIKKGALCPKNTETEIIATESNTPKQQIESTNCEDIEISIKIGSTITNILIKKKTDIQIKVNSDREVQTSLGPYNISPNVGQLKNSNDKNKYTDLNSINNNPESNKDIEVAINTRNQVLEVHKSTKVDKSTPGKKNTASAETATAQFEITESVEKELSNIMEYETAEGNVDVSTNINSVTESQQVNTVQHDNGENLDYLNDLDIFNSGSVREGNVQVLKEHAPSEILVSTVCSRVRTQRNVEKRVRDDNKEDVINLPKNKKVKIQQGSKQKNTLTDSETINYDAIMGQVFANIDADIEKTKDTEIIKDTPDTGDTNELNQLQDNHLPVEYKTQLIKLTDHSSNATITKNLQEYFNEKDSENVFSIMEKDDENCEINKDHIPHQVVEHLTPVICYNLDTSQESCDSVNKANKSDKNLRNYDESDRSVVEETPQKNVSVAKLKRASTANISLNTSNDTNKIPSNPCVQSVKSVINLTDTVPECNNTNKDCTVVETAGKKLNLETPLTITKFANHITHKSTPVARKSLNFDYEKDEDNDPEETLCPTTDIIAKTTQEKEFMTKAFEKTPLTPTARPLIARNMSKANRNYCLAASCLTSTEVARVKVLCAQYKWSYVDKYTKDITHLVVGVDEEKKSQRSVKYMCALAASKWIVSFDWINTCLQSKEIADEEYFEALDTFGEPGPRRSRIAKQKLFQGIKFYCMPPFSVLDVNTLKSMLVAAGGLVVNDMREVVVSEGSTEPALLLAEPEHTQEDRFIYLAMEKNIVPVNYEWVLNCLGSYTLSSIQELLLCPSSLLQAATVRWPDVFLTQD